MVQGRRCYSKSLHVMVLPDLLEQKDMVWQRDAGCVDSYKNFSDNLKKNTRLSQQCVGKSAMV